MDFLLIHFIAKRLNRKKQNIIKKYLNFNNEIRKILLFKYGKKP